MKRLTTILAVVLVLVVSNTAVQAKVKWSKIEGIPPDIADGDDDTQLTEAQVDAYVSNNGYVQFWFDIPDIPPDITDGDDDTQLTEAQVDAYVSNNNYVKFWGDIPDIPAGFADGIDNIGGADSDWIISDSNMYSGVSGNVGIGTTSPGAKLDVDLGIFSGAGGAATIGSSTNSATGDYAIAMGYGTTASGWHSTAMGSETTASVYYSTAMGYSTTANGWYSTAMGRSTTASDFASTAMGDDTIASGDHSTAMGFGSDANGSVSTAMGRSTIASGPRSTAMGESTTASGTVSTAMGYVTIASGSFSTAMGDRTTASGDWGSTAMGSITTASGDSSTAMGRLTTAGGDYSTAMGHSITVGSGASYSFGIGLRYDVTPPEITQSNTMAIMGGNVGIGTTSPNGKLDVNGSIYQRGGVLHADYVFEPGYQLESIDEHSEFMWANKHLAAIPEAETDEAGQQIVEVGAHRKGIVEELEKAHIYIEQLHQRIKELEGQNETMEARLVAIEAVVGKLAVRQEGGQR